jgi:hypothetical protein
MKSLIIAVDFDGTIVEHKFPAIGNESPGAFMWLRRWQELGGRLILWTMRSDNVVAGRSYLTDAVEYCRQNGVEFWGVNENPEQKSWTTSPKVYANFYVDDAGVLAPLSPPATPDSGGAVINWAKVGPYIERQLINISSSR